jgi:drug/metabolite transporter (DMT)-like permease
MPQQRTPIHWLPGNSRRERTLVLLAFLAIYLVWGSTYLAIRYAVETIPPLFVAGTRHLIAGALLLAWCWWKGLRPTAAQWRASLIVGALFFLGGHGLLHWAEQVVPSGLAALLIATEPIMIAILVALAGQARITLPVASGMLLGLAGIALLMQADVSGAGRNQLIGSAAILLGTLSWAVGIIYSNRGKLHPHPVMSAAMSLLAGAALLILTGIVVGEGTRLSLATVSFKSFASLLYLVFFGSLVAFTAYVWLLQRCSPTLVATHTYVNPIVAVLLGWALAGEPLTIRTALAGLLVLAAIGLLGRGTQRGAIPSRKSQEVIAQVADESDHARAQEANS